MNKSRKTPKNYDHNKIEKKWQKKWSSSKIYKTTESGNKDKFYVLDMFPYPSGEGLHVGHPKGYIATDVISRMKRMNGLNVLHPMGFDAFGLPAENYALKTKTNPMVSVAKNVARYKKQLEILGCDYDWSREINTTDPKYYKWTQWIFLQLLKKGLAYESYEPINWCPSCKTGLANEDVEDGRCERCGTPIEKKPMRQWVLKITDYAERLLNDLELENGDKKPLLNWPESIKELQKNWIGRSEGAEIKFKVKSSKLEVERQIEVFTTRPDTLFGVTYVVLAPEYKLIQELLPNIENKDEVASYIEQTKKEELIDRTDEKKEKTGVPLKGVFAINPANQEKVPVWIADYVLADYGTGAVMAVPAHDERDWDFAKKYRLSIRVAIKPKSDFVDMDQERNRKFAEELFILSRSEDFLMILVGGMARSASTNGKFGFHSDVDIFVDKKGWNEVKQFLIERNFRFKEKEVDGEKGKHSWKNHISFWKDNEGVWLDMFLLEEDGGNYFDTVTGKRFVWGQRDIFEEKIINKIRFLIPKQKIIEAISLNLSSVWHDCFVENGLLTNSGKFDGMDSEEIMKEITSFVGGKWVTKYKLRDWVFSRQRYWGEPIPVIHCEKCGVVPVPEKDLPVKLPKVKSYEPTGTGESPLAAIDKWVNVKCPKCKGKAKRETNTMPQWAGSSWYYLRYEDPKNDKQLVDPKKEKYWSSVDTYVGGAEHATRHLIYARFWHKFLYDIGVVTTREPFRKLQHVGLIMGEDGRKMSKRFGNVINPDELVGQFGADTLRVYEMFMGPFDQQISWSTAGMVGCRRFIEKVWRLVDKIEDKKTKITNPESKKDQKIDILINKTVKKVTEDVESMRFNTAISAMMIAVNEIEKVDIITRNQFETLLKLLAPFAPHFTEELWSMLGNKKSIHISEWPKFDSSLLGSEQVTIVVQVNGKVRASFVTNKDSDRTLLEQKAKDITEVKKWTDGKTIIKVIVVPNKLVNIVC